MTAPEPRWRPIDNFGNVNPRPAPEAPDDPSEGETGPPEVDGDLVEVDLNSPHEVCRRCGRSTWDTTQFGEIDSMTQPDGGICGGKFGSA